MVTPDVIAMRVDRSLADPRYLMHYLNSDNARRVAFGLAFGTTRLRLTLPLFRSLAVPLPPLSEQRSIVAEVDRLLSVADQQEGVVELAMRRAARLREAILDAAFNARLLPVAAPPSQELHPVVVSGV
jgi:type I restriction enzyme S subunit